MTAATSSSPASGRFIDVNGVALYYEEQGESDPLILIHGGLGSSAMWQAVLPHLVDGFRVITLDSRGHGRSTNPSGELSYPLIADDVAALIAALGLARPVVGGWSDGGQVALELGARHPGVAGGLIVGAAYPDFDSSGLRETWKELLGADDAGTPDIAQLEENFGDFAGVVKSLHPGGAQQWQVLVQQTAPMWLDYAGLTPDDLRGIAAPALVLAGDRDELIPLDLMVSLYRALPNAELAICPQADHFGPGTPERAGVFAGMIRDFAGRHTTDQESRSEGTGPRVDSSCSTQQDTGETAKEGTMSAKKSKGFTDEERAAMRERAKELKAEERANKNRAAGESAVLAKIAEMPQPDRAMAERLHEVVKASAPDLSPKTWYGMPAYANKDGKVMCFFQSAKKFDARYATLGFSDVANLDEGAMWPTSFALKELGAAEEAKIGALVKRAVG